MCHWFAPSFRMVFLLVLFLEYLLLYALRSGWSGCIRVRYPSLVIHVFYFQICSKTAAAIKNAVSSSLILSPLSFNCFSQAFHFTGEKLPLIVKSFCQALCLALICERLYEGGIAEPHLVFMGILECSNLFNLPLYVDKLPRYLNYSF